MAQVTKIKKDELGLFVMAGGYISRAFYGTIFKEGDEVKTHHFGGSTNVGVTFNEKKFNFKSNNKNFEFWSTTGLHNLNHERKIFEPNKFSSLFGKKYTSFEEYVKLTTEWYQNRNFSPLSKMHNNTFKERFGNG